MIIYMDCQNHPFFNTKIHLYSSWTNDNDISNSLYSNNVVLNQMGGLKTINSNVLMDLNWTLTPTYKEVIYGTFVVVIFMILDHGLNYIIYYFLIFIKIIKLNLLILMLFHLIL